MPGSKLFADQVFLHPVMGQVSLLARKSKVWLYRLRAPVEVIDRVAPVKLDVPLGGFAVRLQLEVVVGA